MSKSPENDDFLDYSFWDNEEEQTKDIIEFRIKPSRRFLFWFFKFLPCRRYCILQGLDIDFLYNKRERKTLIDVLDSNLDWTTIKRVPANQPQ